MDQKAGAEVVKRQHALRAKEGPMGRLMDSESEAPAKEVSPQLVQLAETIGRSANATAVFGAPINHEDRTFIPVAETRFGLGAGESFIAKGEGGGMTAKPLGFIIIDKTGAYFRRTPPRSLAPLALGVIVGFAIAMRLMRPPRARPAG
jgi:hypothetical protein